MARHANERLLALYCVFCQHPVEIGSEPVGQIIGLDRPAEPPRMEATSNSIADLDPRYPIADGCNLTRTVGKRYHAELSRTATAALEDHQVAVVERARAHSHQDLLRPGLRVIARSQDYSVNL